MSGSVRNSPCRPRRHFSSNLWKRMDTTGSSLSSTHSNAPLVRQIYPPPPPPARAPQTLSSFSSPAHSSYSPTRPHPTPPPTLLTPPPPPPHSSTAPVPIHYGQGGTYTDYAIGDTVSRRSFEAVLRRADDAVALTRPFMKGEMIRGEYGGHGFNGSSMQPGNPQAAAAGPGVGGGPCVNKYVSVNDWSQSRFLPPPSPPYHHRASWPHFLRPAHSLRSHSLLSLAPPTRSLPPPPLAPPCHPLSPFHSFLRVL